MPTALSKSAKLYQERMLPEDRTTRRSPAFYLNLDELHPTHTLEMEPPYPIAEVKQVEGGKYVACSSIIEGVGNHPPDGALTDPWLHGSKELS